MKTKKQWVLLLVEDDEGDIWATKRAFDSLKEIIHFQVVTDGEQAIQYMKQATADAKAEGILKPSLVILDLNLPKVHGFDVLEKLKSDDKTRHIPVIVLTTSSQDADVRRAYLAGASSYLVKPSSLDGYRKLACSIDEYYLQTALLPH